MKLKVDFVNSERDRDLEKSIITRLKNSFNQGFISSVKVLIKKCSTSKTWKSEIDLISSAGSILHTQSKSSEHMHAFDEAIFNMERQIVKLKNEKLKKRA
jgi:ribosome-associated translation inhibitor RaiA